ncbi:hypothetical protein TI04_11710 [Achromatium sp. WMS2]|nr:hypothetical protein TI04_11710 [Achromatium sp. WMS2]
MKLITNLVVPLFKFILGIILLQISTATLIAMAMNTARTELWILALILILAHGLITAFWFNSILQHYRRAEQDHTATKLAQERDKMHKAYERRDAELAKLQAELKAQSKRRSNKKTRTDTATEATTDTPTPQYLGCSGTVSCSVVFGG